MTHASSVADRVGAPRVPDPSILDTSLLAGPLPAILTALGGLGLAYLLLRRPRRWWRHTVPVLLAGSAVTVVIADIALLAWRPFPDPLPARVLCWAGLMIFAVALTAARVRRAGTPTARIRAAGAGLLALVLVATLSAMKINAFYGYRPTLGAALGVPPVHETDFSALAGAKPTLATPRWLPLAATWKPPPGLPPTGRFTRVAVTGTASGFAARAAWLYLPPAYLASPRPLLPVLVLIAGQPGGPQDWLTGGRLATVLNSFAAAHAGLAPVVVVPDATGSTLANPLCLDSKLGNAETYLRLDVPRWILTHLQVDADTAHWAIGGFSYGGTCALQLAVRAPALYPTFLDISGQQEPTLGDHPATVRATYGGDERRFRGVNPLDILAAGRFASSVGVIAVGAKDREYGPQALRVAAAARAAGITVTALRFPGGHSWVIATEALQAALPIIAARAHLISAALPSTPGRTAPPHRGDR
jgi:S-formylglutathione hydrolase FrmB